MPASKPDLTKPHGRLAHARQAQKLDQGEFASALHYTLKGWQNIEQGLRKLTVETLLEANKILKLDFNYYFGRVDYEAASGEVATSDQRMIAFARETAREVVRETAPSYGTDPTIAKMSMRMQANQDLLAHVQRIAYEPSDVIREIDRFAAYLLQQKAVDRERAPEMQQGG